MDIDLEKVKDLANKTHDCMIDGIFDALGIARASAPAKGDVRDIYKYALMTLTQLLAAECISVANAATGDDHHKMARSAFKSCITDAERMIDFYFVSQKNKRAAN